MADEPTLVRREELSRSDLRRRDPVSNQQTAIVYQTKQGPLVESHGRLTKGEMWLDTPRAVYSVDLREHHHSLDLRLPAKGDAFFFAAKLEVTWRVHNSVNAVRHGADSAAGAVRTYLDDQVRDFGREFRIEDSELAEKRIAAFFRERMPMRVNICATACAVRASFG